MKLTLKAEPQTRIDASPLTVQLCSELSEKALAAQTFKTIQGEVALGDLFKIEKDSSPTLTISGDCQKFDYLGAQMSEGHIIVDGSAGDYSGALMTGGQLDINGNVGSYAACAMSNGTIIVTGDAGDRTGGASSGAVCGMAGGNIIILGNAGNRTGDLMRRGLIVVRGNNGEYCASKMRAGTIVIFGRNGNHVAYGMKRGTVFLNNTDIQLGETFVKQPGSYSMEFLVLVFKHICKLSTKLQSLPMQKLVRRHIGDLAVGGKGEILTPS